MVIVTAWRAGVTVTARVTVAPDSVPESSSSESPDLQ